MMGRYHGKLSIIFHHIQGSETHEELSLRSVAYYNARTMNYIPPTPDDILDVDDDEDGADDEAHRDVPEDAEVVGPEPMNGDGDGHTAPVLGDEGHLGAEEVVTAAPDIDHDEEDNMILNSIQNADQGNRMYSLEALDRHIKAKHLNLRLRRPTSNDGNCFFDTLSDLIEKFQIRNVPQDKDLLRQAICCSFTSHPNFSTWMVDNFKKPVVFQKYISGMKKSGTYTDNMGLIIAVAAHFLGKSQYFTLN